MRNQNNNINSLLDTLANVIGILIIVFAVTQIIVTDAASKIKYYGYTAKELNSNTLKEKEQEKDRLQEQVDNIKPIDPNMPQRQEIYANICDIRDKYKDSKYANIDASEIDRIVLLEYDAHRISSEISELKDIYGDSEFSTMALSEVQKLNEALNKELEILYKSVNEYEQDIIRIDSLLNNNTNLSFNVDNSVRLPDPKLAPESVKPILWTCRYGRIMEVPIDPLSNLLNDEIPKSVGNSNSTVQRIINAINYFENNRIGVSGIYWKLIPVLDENDGLKSLYACISCDKEAGEDKHELSLNHSTYKTRINYIKDKKDEYCFQFHVWEDSFDIYLMARQIASQNGIRAGWIVYYEDELFIGTRLWPETKSESDSGTTGVMID